VGRPAVSIGTVGSWPRGRPRTRLVVTVADADDRDRDRVGLSGIV
jgi:hypothetical protein